MSLFKWLIIIVIIVEVKKLQFEKKNESEFETENLITEAIKVMSNPKANQDYAK